MTSFLYYLLRWSVLVLIGLLIYGQTFSFGFVFDDSAFVVNNLYIKDFSRIPLIWHFFPMTRLMGMYSFALNYYFNQIHPQGYHIFNFIVHLAATGLVWALAGLLFQTIKWFPAQDRLSKELPFMIAVLFLVHPCQTQAVSYISQRFESMATVFYLGTMYCYLSARLAGDRVNKIRLFGLSGLLAVFGLMTKEVVITVPAMMLAGEWILFPKKDNKTLYIVLAVAGVLLYGLFTKMGQQGFSVFSQSVLSESHDGDMLTPARYVLTQMRVFLTFLRLLVLPIHQNLDYDYPVSTGLLSPPLTLVGLCVMGSMIGLIIKLRRSVPLIAFGLAWMLITFSANLAPRANVIFEHKLYLISFGFFVAAVAAVSMLSHRRTLVLGIVGCMIALLAMAAFQRNKVWKNDLVLWEDAVQKSPDKARPHNNYGFSLDKEGQYTQALVHLNRAIDIYPRYADAYNNRGMVYYHQGNLTQAAADLTQAIDINSGFTDAYVNRGAVFSRQGNFAGAVADYNKAILLNPDRVEGYNNRGNAFVKQKMYAQAINDFNKALDIDPHFAQTYNNLAVVFYQLKEYDKAWVNLRKAQALGYAVNPQFYHLLKKVSGVVPQR